MNVKRLYVTPELITAMLTTGYTLKGEIKISAGLPEGAVLMGCGYDVTRRAWALDFQHHTFSYAVDGQAPPELDVIVQKTSPVLTDALSE